MQILRVAVKKIRVMKIEESTDDQIQPVVDNIDWSLVETTVNDQLPDGYYCKVEDS